MAGCFLVCETNQGNTYAYFSHYHRTISSTDPQAHLSKDTNLTPCPVQFFNDDEKLQFAWIFFEGEKEGGGGVKWWILVRIFFQLLLSSISYN